MQIENKNLNESNELIKIDWNILTICNFKCSYCYARKSEQWNRILNDKQIDHIINVIKNSKHNFQISLMGGEPSLFPKLNILLEKLNLLNVKRVVIYTNGIKALNVKNTNIYISYHPKEAIDEIIITNIKTYLNNDNAIIINVLCLDKYKIKINSFINKIKNLDVKIAYIHICLNGKTFLTEIDKQLRYNFNNELYTSSDIIKNNLNKFKGYKCNINLYCLHINGDLYLDCEDKPILNIFRVKDLNCLKYYKMCDKEQCYDECWFNFTKTKGTSKFYDISI